MRILTIQPLNKNVWERLPYPYLVNLEDGKVLRQEIWNGNPARFIGFTLKGEQEIRMDWCQVSILADMFLNTIPESYFPVFSNDKNEWFTLEPLHGYSLNIREVEDADSCDPVST